MTMNMTKTSSCCLPFYVDGTGYRIGSGYVDAGRADDVSGDAAPSMPPQGMPPQGQQGKSISEFTAAQRITGKQALLVNQDITATEADENAVLAEQGANVTLQKVRLSKTGDTTK